MPKPPEPSSYFTIARSRILVIAINCLHALAILACWLNGLPVHVRLMLSVFVAISWFFQFKACKSSNKCLRYSATDGWAICLDDENYFEVKIKPTTVIGRILAVVHFQTNAQCNTLLILNDAMTANDYRRLVVLLKISQ